MKFTINDPLTEEQLEKIDQQRKEIIHKRMRETPSEGVVVNYMGRGYLVYPTVFWPHADSQPLVRNMVINRGDCVLDVGTGSGVIAIEAALRGAGAVYATEINRTGVETARRNIELHGVKDRVKVFNTATLFNHGLQSEAVSNRGFNVITANLPFLEHPAIDVVERSTYDPSFEAYRDLFEAAESLLSLDGRMYLSQANFGNSEKMLEMAAEAGFNAELIGRARDLHMPEKVYYAFELRK